MRERGQSDGGSVARRGLVRTEACGPRVPAVEIIIAAGSECYDKFTEFNTRYVGSST